ncbi:Caleosin-domain-containing protein [Trametopsis cervina]|nr:Caleosin-domain-containing protein [Trametopsis cervina]
MAREPNSVTTAIPAVVATRTRVVYQEWKHVRHPSIAHANLAVTEQHPIGTTYDGYNNKHANKTVLQQHCAFFDLNGDGVITPRETFVSFRLLGWNLFLTVVSVIFIHVGFSYVTQPPNQWLPDVLFRIHLPQLHRAKHGSDSGTYDHEGRFRPQQFADFFSKYGRRLRNGDYGLTFREAMYGAWSQRCVMDVFGVTAAFFEWSATYITLWPSDGVMRMEDVRQVYDGSYFYKIAGDRRANYPAVGKGNT